MSGEDGALEIVVDEFGRRIVVAFYLVAYHLHLLVYVGLRVGAVEHDVGEQIHGPCCVLMQNGGMIDRVLLAREGVEVASHALQRVEDLYCLSFLCSLEGHVFHKMGHALLPRQLIACAGVHGVATVDHGRC